MQENRINNSDDDIRSRDASVETNNSNDVINENHQISQQKEVACIGETK